MELRLALENGCKLTVIHVVFALMVVNGRGRMQYGSRYCDIVLIVVLSAGHDYESFSEGKFTIEHTDNLAA